MSRQRAINTYATRSDGIGATKVSAASKALIADHEGLSGAECIRLYKRDLHILQKRPLRKLGYRHEWEDHRENRFGDTSNHEVDI